MKCATEAFSEDLLSYFSSFSPQQLTLTIKMCHVNQ